MSKFVDPSPKLFRIVRELEESLAVADRVIADQASNIAALDVECEAFLQTNRGLIDRVHELEAEVAKMHDFIFELSRKEARLKELEAEVVTLDDSLFTARDEIARLREALKTEENITMSLQAGLIERQAEIARLRAVIERLEGEYQDQKVENARLRGRQL